MSKKNRGPVIVVRDNSGVMSLEQAKKIANDKMREQFRQAFTHFMTTQLFDQFGMAMLMDDTFYEEFKKLIKEGHPTNSKAVKNCFMKELNLQLQRSKEEAKEAVMPEVVEMLSTFQLHTTQETSEGSDMKNIATQHVPQEQPTTLETVTGLTESQFNDIVDKALDGHFTAIVNGEVHPIPNPLKGETMQTETPNGPMTQTSVFTAFNEKVEEIQTAQQKLKEEAKSTEEVTPIPQKEDEGINWGSVARTVGTFGLGASVGAAGMWAFRKFVG